MEASGDVGGRDANGYADDGSFLPEPWAEYVDERGVWYYNPETGETTWDFPGPGRVGGRREAAAAAVADGQHQLPWVPADSAATDAAEVGATADRGGRGAHTTKFTDPLSHGEIHRPRSAVEKWFHPRDAPRQRPATAGARRAGDDSQRPPLRRGSTLASRLMAKLRGDHGDGGDAGAHTGDSPGGRSASPADGAPHGVSAPTLDHSARTSDKAHKSHRKHKKHKKHCKHKKHKKSKKHGHKRHSASSHDSGDSTSNDDGDGGSVADPAATALAEHYQVSKVRHALPADLRREFTGHLNSDQYQGLLDAVIHDTEVAEAGAEEQAQLFGAESPTSDYDVVAAAAAERSDGAALFGHVHQEGEHESQVQLDGVATERTDTGDHATGFTTAATWSPDARRPDTAPMGATWSDAADHEEATYDWYGGRAGVPSTSAGEPFASPIRADDTAAVWGGDTHDSTGQWVWMPSEGGQQETSIVDTSQLLKLATRILRSSQQARSDCTATSLETADVIDQLHTLASELGGDHSSAPVLRRVIQSLGEMRSQWRRISVLTNDAAKGTEELLLLIPEATDDEPYDEAGSDVDSGGQAIADGHGAGADVIAEAERIKQEHLEHSNAHKSRIARERERQRVRALAKLKARQDAKKQNERQEAAERDRSIRQRARLAAQLRRASAPDISSLKQLNGPVNQGRRRSMVLTHSGGRPPPGRPPQEPPKQPLGKRRRRSEAVLGTESRRRVLRQSRERAPNAAHDPSSANQSGGDSRKRSDGLLARLTRRMSNIDVSAMRDAVRNAGPERSNGADGGGD